MLDIIAFIIGVVIAILGLAISIALHECGHLFFAKKFGVRVPQYMVGFGPTLWSRTKGETEYGIKAIPLGGYVSMIGMYPPRAGEKVGAQSTGFVSQLIEDGRQASAESIPPGEEHRAFYKLPVWKRLLVMFGGPLMNFVVAILCYMIVATGFGVYQPSTTIAGVYQCVATAAERQDPNADDCPEPGPAYAAGLQPGDRVVSVDGTPVTSWDQLQSIIRVSTDQTLAFEVDRGEATLNLEVTPRANEIRVIDDLTGEYVLDEAGEPKTETVGFVGFTSQRERQHESPLYAFELAEMQARGVVNVIITMPQRVADMFAAGFLGAERDPNGPVSVVGVGIITGQIAQQHEVPIVDRAATMVGLVAAVNVALGLMNLIPLPPLDGGHIAAALWDGLRKFFARLFGKPEPAPFDAAILLPVTIVVSGILMLIGALFIFTDIVNPIQLFG
ncbi:RIP metalloprotease [Gulosibacter macacae]|uniref:RIP metalloprotease n=1 Tax=Gulosibacter macacae TaxID=2488791 RepID=A0A3P3W2V6_9MICO|nr:site-2 protease family protein [Gulosibacter macacae]RRJ88718.1 RIP metalloprotease [Gulosibacter macacae]